MSSNPPTSVSPGRAAAEIAAVIATGTAFLVYENILRAPKLLFLIPCAVLWSAYALRRLRSDPSLASVWGLSMRRHFGAASRASAGFFFAGATLMAAYRLVAGWRPLPPSAWILFAIYPAWSFLQQFAVQSLVASNLKRLNVPPAITTAAAAALFGAAHLPDVPLAALCAAAGLAWTTIFLRAPNLVPIAVTHAWLGTLAYCWVLERDPWREMFPGS
ncbi:MAG: hypothetical protein HY716_10700 [Planctomycetes bacterium]|nr:hypothetical protein [Planctomycetota bacterium]